MRLDFAGVFFGKIGGKMFHLHVASLLHLSQGGRSGNVRGKIESGLAFGLDVLVGVAVGERAL